MPDFQAKALISKFLYLANSFTFAFPKKMGVVLLLLFAGINSL